MSLPFLLEIGCEEIPDWMIIPALNQLQHTFQTLLDQHGLGGMVKSVDATPRRLVLRADELKARQADAEEVVLGPPKSAGAGAASGFAKKMGVAVDALGVQPTARGEYLSFRKLTEGRETIAVLTETLPDLILKLYFPKTMYWNGKGSERFIRPIRWIVALLGYDVVPLVVAGVRAGNITQGHRLLGGKQVTVSTGTFKDQLEANGVILQAEDRRARIEQGMADVRVKKDAALLQTLVYLTEYPTPIVGSFDSQFLDLPQEILITVMRHHQRYFPVEDENGNLAPQFVAVMNTNADPEGLVRRGNERVLRARFNDARFFWQVDQKKKLGERLEDLKNVTFQNKLGTYFEKTERIVAITLQLGGDNIAEMAAWRCKCDLTTEMVKEFTDLQGIVGGLYLRADGQPENVWRAIYEHYKPISMDDSVPSTHTGRIVALADKADTLRECFRVGLIPTGSKDPFALRRAAQGIIKIIVEGKIAVSLSALFDNEVNSFLVDRIEHYFRESRGFKYDEVRACMAAGWSDLLELEVRLIRIRSIRTSPDLEPLAASFKRIKNILKQAEFKGGHAFREDVLEPGPERDLYNEIQRTAGQPLELRIASMRPKVDLFFDKVLVNARDEAVRLNRLTLLHNLLAEFSTIADFSEIVTERAITN